MARPEDSTPTPVLIGGTGRCGTTVMGGLLGSHTAVRVSLPREVKFLTEPAGLVDLCVSDDRGTRLLAQAWQRQAARVPGIRTRFVFAQFEESMRGRWWQRRNRQGRESGLQLTMNVVDREKALVGLKQRLRAGNRLQAGRNFFEEIVRAQYGHGSESFWVDTSPPNVVRAPELTQLLPNAKFIWMVRDGRSTAASVLSERWGPNTPDAAITWWARRLARCHNGVTKLPSESFLLIRLEDLVVREREVTFSRILNFLDLPDDTTMRTFFAERMPATRLRLDAWRGRVSDPESFERCYIEARDQLLDQGFDPYESPS
ncbi:MAG: hypothetical protein RJB01_1617 [Actinomycetota bacterium]